MNLLLVALKKVAQTQSDFAPVSAFSQVERVRTTGHTLFALKAAPAPTKSSLLPLTLFCGILLATGAYYAWRNTFYSPPTPRSKPQPTIVAASAAAVQNSEPVTEQATFSPAKSALHIKRNQTADAVDPTLLAAWHAYRAGDFATAWQLYRSVLQQDGKNHDALLGTAAIARQQGRDDIAAHYYGRVLALDSRNPVARSGLAALATGDMTRMESELKLQLAYRPDAAALHFALGNLYAEQARWSEAQQAYLYAYQRNPDDAQFSFNLAVSHDHLGQSELATQHYQLALQLDRSAASTINREQVVQRISVLSTPNTSSP